MHREKQNFLVLCSMNQNILVRWSMKLPFKEEKDTVKTMYILSVDIYSTNTYCESVCLSLYFFPLVYNFNFRLKPTKFFPNKSLYFNIALLRTKKSERAWRERRSYL